MASANASNNPITAQWLSSFADRTLTALVQDALNHNYDLKAAAARVDSAREQARIDGSPRWPQLYFVTGYRHDALASDETGAFLPRPDLFLFSIASRSVTVQHCVVSVFDNRDSTAHLFGKVFF